MRGINCNTVGPWKSFPDPVLAYFRFSSYISSLNQGQESIFKIRQYAQSISSHRKTHICVNWVLSKRSRRLSLSRGISASRHPWILCIDTKTETVYLSFLSLKKWHFLKKRVGGITLSPPALNTKIQMIWKVVLKIRNFSPWYSIFLYLHFMWNKKLAQLFCSYIIHINKNFMVNEKH
jgi:hypothetical protein